MSRRRAAVLGAALGLALCALAAWQLSWLGAELYSPIPHGKNEDWDWQLTLYEASRALIVDYRMLPGWTPWTQGGVPLLANPEFPAFYPLFWLIPAWGTGPGLKIWILLHLWLLVLGGYVAGRELGLSPLAAHGAALAALCSAFIPEFITYGHIMYLPLGWLPIAWALQRRGRWPWAGAALAMSFLAGGHYLLVYGALLLGLDGLLRGLEAERLRWLVPALLANGLLLGQRWAAWPLGLALLAAAAWQRPAGLRRAVGPVLLAGLIAALLLGPKLTTAPALFERAERLSAQVSLSIADEYSPAMAWRVLSGQIARPSGHEGQNVFWHGAPLILGLAGLSLSGWRPPAGAPALRHMGLLGLLSWNLGWGGSTPVNLLAGLHRLPGFDLLRVVERYSLLWTLALGWGVGALLDRAWRRHRALALALAVPVGLWVWAAAPRAAAAQRLGPGRRSALRPGAFHQVEDALSNYEALRANRGKLDCWTTAWLEDPAPGLTPAGDPDYRGEVWLLETGETLEASLEPGRIEVALEAPGTVVVNQNAFRGWAVDGRPAGSHRGLLAATLPAGRHTFRYRPPGLWPGLLLSACGLAALLGFARSRAPGPAASSSGPRP